MVGPVQTLRSVPKVFLLSTPNALASLVESRAPSLSGPIYSFNLQWFIQVESLCLYPYLTLGSYIPGSLYVPLQKNFFAPNVPVSVTNMGCPDVQPLHSRLNLLSNTMTYMVSAFKQ